MRMAHGVMCQESTQKVCTDGCNLVLYSECICKKWNYILAWYLEKVLRWYNNIPQVLVKS